MFRGGVPLAKLGPGRLRRRDRAAPQRAADGDGDRGRSVFAAGARPGALPCGGDRVAGGRRGARRRDRPAASPSTTTDTSSQHPLREPGRAERANARVEPLSPIEGPGRLAAGAFDHLGSRHDRAADPHPLARRGQLRPREQRGVPHLPGGSRDRWVEATLPGTELRDRAGRDRLPARALPRRRGGRRHLPGRRLRHVVDPDRRAGHREGGLGGRRVGVGGRGARRRSRAGPCRSRTRSGRGSTRRSPRTASRQDAAAPLEVVAVPAARRPT